MVGLDYQRVFNFTTELATQGMTYLFKHYKHRPGEDTDLWINETKRASSERQHVGAGREAVNVTELPEAIDEAERN